MRSPTNRFPYGETERAQVLGLSYMDTSARMILVLPRRDVSIADVETREGVADWLRALRVGGDRRIVTILLPRFRCRASVDVQPLLGDGAGDLGGISAEPDLHLGPCVHEGRIAVDENGTEAEGQTRLVAVGGGDERVDFVADRPFLFLIHDGASGAILFMGRIEDPAAEPVPTAAAPNAR
jgi:serpin B